MLTVLYSGNESLSEIQDTWDLSSPTYQSARLLDYGPVTLQSTSGPGPPPSQVLSWFFGVNSPGGFILCVSTVLKMKE